MAARMANFSTEDQIFCDACIARSDGHSLRPELCQIPADARPERYLTKVVWNNSNLLIQSTFQQSHILTLRCYALSNCPRPGGRSGEFVATDEEVSPRACPSVD